MGNCHECLRNKIKAKKDKTQQPCLLIPIGEDKRCKEHKLNGDDISDNRNNENKSRR